MLKRFLKVLFVIILFFIVAVDIMFFVELRKTNGNSVKAAVRSFKKCCWKFRWNSYKFRTYIYFIVRSK